MAPKDVTEQNQHVVWKKLYDDSTTNPLRKQKRYTFKQGDYVRLSHTRKPFTREYEQRWSGELFVITDRIWNQDYAVYKLKDYAGDDIEGTFYEEELQKVTPNEVYRIEKIIKTRKRKGLPKEYLVRWMRWPPKYDSWVSEKDMHYY